MQLLRVCTHCQSAHHKAFNHVSAQKAPAQRKHASAMKLYKLQRNVSDTPASLQPGSVRRNTHSVLQRCVWLTCPWLTADVCAVASGLPSVSLEEDAFSARANHHPYDPEHLIVQVHPALSDLHPTTLPLRLSCFPCGVQNQQPCMMVWRYAPVHGSAVNNVK